MDSSKCTSKHASRFTCALVYALVVVLYGCIPVCAWPGMGKSGDAAGAHAAAGVSSASSNAAAASASFSSPWRAAAAASSSSSSSFILNRMERIIVRPREEAIVQSSSSSSAVSSASDSFLPLATCTNSCSNAGVCVTSTANTAVCACNGGFFGVDCSQTYVVSASSFFQATGESEKHFMTFGYNASTASVTMRFVINDPSNYFGLIFLPDKVDGMSGGSGGAGDCWVFGALSTGNVLVSDRYSTGQSSPPVDTQQDLQSTHTWVNSTHVSVEFTRKLNTGDSHDIVFSATPGNGLVFDWVVGNGAAAPNDKLSGHDYAGAVGFIRIDVAGGSISVLSDGVEWPQLYTVFAIGGGIVAAVALLVQRDFVKRSPVGKILRRSVYYQEQPCGMDAYLMDFFTSSLNLSLSELLFTIAYVCCLVVGITLSQTQYNNQYRPQFYVVGHLAALHFALALLPAAKQSVWLRLFGLDYDIAVKWHRRCARFAIFFAWIHLITQVLCWNASILFSLTTVQYGMGPVLGVLGTISFTCLGCCALSYCRRKNFELFFYSHYFCFLLGMCLSALHSINLRWLLIVPGVLWGADLLYRFAFGYVLQRVEVLSVRALNDDHAGVAVSELQLKGVSGPLCLKAAAGDWVYVNVPAVSLHEWHPFSISSISGEKSEKISLHIMRMNGEEQWSGKLFSQVQSSAARCVNGQQEGGKFPAVFVHGPYRSFDLPIRSFPIVVLVAGGIGITPIASLIGDLVSRRQQNFSSPLKLYVIYVSKSLKGLTQWFAHQLSPLVSDDSMYQLKLCYTGNNSVDINAVKSATSAVVAASPRQEQQPRHRNHTASKKSGTIVPASVAMQVLDDKKAEVELVEVEGSPSHSGSLPPVAQVLNVSALELAGRSASNSAAALNDAGNDEGRSANPSPIPPSAAGENEKFTEERISSVLLTHVQLGRPDLALLFSGVLQTAESGSFRPSDVAVMACGPKSLVAAAHSAADRMGFPFHAEGFEY